MEWLQETSVSVYLRESNELWIVVLCAHVLSLGLSVGTIAVLDIRLLGWGMRGTPVSWIFEQLRPWTLWGFGIIFATGLLLAVSEPVKCSETASFYLKMIFMALAGANAFVFERRIYPTVSAWDTADAVPPRARFAGAAGLVLWSGVIACGRWFAY
jgi:hypothetical protein